MNRVLFKAAAIVNIAAAALIYVACSGDDGKDGAKGADGTSCEVQPNATGNYDILCGNIVIGQLNHGVQGPPGLDGAFAGKGDPGEPGVACSGTTEAASPANPYGGVRITCGTQQFFVSNGAPGQGGGDGPGGGCNVVSATVPVTTDKAITLTCADSRSATILVCPPGAAAAEGSTGLLLDDEGRTGQCLPDGTISRGATIVLSNVCGSTLFSPKTHFCQRTITTSGPDSGSFATLGASGAVVAGDYPYNKADITDAESDYNSTNLKAGANAVVLPLCGAYPATNDEGILPNHNESTVYDANQYCARNLVIKIGPGTTGRYGASDGANKNGRPISGSGADNDATQSYGDAWSVIARGTCLINLLENAQTDSKINGYNYTSQANSDKISRACDWIEADSLDVVGASKYTFCPAGRPVVALDDIKCIARTGCIYHSTIDNTCLGQDAVVSTDGVRPGNQPAVPARITSANKPLGSLPSSWTYVVSKLQGSGIKNTPVGSRFGLGTKYTGNAVNNTGFLNAGGNLWSKACVTQTRTVYYAVNDEYLSNKAFKEATTTLATVDAEGPICGGTVLQPATGGTPAVIQEPIAFENAIACLNGQLSLDAKTANGQSIGYDGTSWDKPLFCVQDGKTAGVPAYGLTPFCKITAPWLAENTANCSGGQLAIDGFKDIDKADVPGVSAQLDGTVCKIIGSSMDRDLCLSIKDVTRPSLKPIPGNVTVRWYSDVTGLTAVSDPHITQAGGCVVTTNASLSGKFPAAQWTSGEKGYLDKSDATGLLNCTNINSASHAAGTLVPGTKSGEWGTRTTGATGDECEKSDGSLVNPTPASSTACEEANGTCVGHPTPAIAADATKTVCETYGNNNGTCNTSGAASSDNTLTLCSAVSGYAPGDWVPDVTWTTTNTWNGSTPGGTVNVCVIKSSIPGAIAADNCAWLNNIGGLNQGGGGSVPGASITWSSN